MTSRVLMETKLQTLKVASFSYFAFSSSKGGCATERSGSSRVVRTMLDVVENGLGELESGRRRSMLEWEEEDAKRIVAWARKSLVVGNGSSGGEVVEEEVVEEEEMGGEGGAGEERSNLNGNEYVDKGEKYREESVEPKFLNGDLEELF